MKTIRFFLLLTLIFSFMPVTAGAENWETYELIERLLSIQSPGKPLIYKDFIIFTADISMRKVGIAFAHENFAYTYWFKQLLVPQDPFNAPIPPGKKVPDPYIDSGIQFHVFEVPEGFNEVEYRLVINGLWTTDPYNPLTRRDLVSGLILSVVSMPPRPIKLDPLKGLPEGLTFTFNGPPGETVTVAGSFNGWDPFMYELKENPAGVYTLTLPLPSGTYQYVFFCQGKRFVDLNNPRRSYSREGKASSEITVP
jgi:hypothetical protein